MKYLQLLAYILVATLVLGSRSYATSDIFTVTDVQIEGRDASATMARTTAIEQGESTAFNTLLTRLSSGSNQASLPNATPAQISQMVVGMEIHREKITPHFYQATVSISFNPEMVQEFLKQHDVSYIDQRSKPILVIPLVAKDRDQLVLDGTGTWYNAWKTVTQNSPYIQYHLIRQDDAIEELSPYVANLAKNDMTLPLTSAKVIEDLKERYHVAIILAVVSYTTQTLSTIETSSYLYNVTHPHTSESQMFFPMKDPKALTLDSMQLAMAQDIDSHLSTQWKRSQTEQKNNTQRIVATVSVPNLTEWKQIEKILQSTPSISQITVDQISPGSLLISLYTTNTPSELAQILERQSLTLKNTPEGNLLTRNSYN